MKHIHITLFIAGVLLIAGCTQNADKNASPNKEVPPVETVTNTSSLQGNVTPEKTELHGAEIAGKTQDFPAPSDDGTPHTPIPVSAPIVGESQSFPPSVK